MMKLSRAETIALGLLAGCAVFTAGFFWGRSTVRGSVIIEDSVPVWSEKAEASSSGGTASAAESLVVNINLDGVDRLCQLPGISQTLAERIVAYREENGPFEDVGDLCLVSGIGEGKLEAIRAHIRV